MAQHNMHLHMPHMIDRCEWHGHCIDIPIETIAHIYGFVNTLFSSAELLCYTVLCSALHVIIGRQKVADKNVCDMSSKTFDDPDDDCELKASKVAAALLATSVFEVLISFLALRGAYKTNVYFCYIWFVFTSLLVIIFPLFQGLFFVVTNWWNAVSYGIMSMSVIHSLIKLYGMFIIMKFVKWVRRSESQHHGDVPFATSSNTNISVNDDHPSISFSQSGHQNDEDASNNQKSIDLKSQLNSI